MQSKKFTFVDVLQALSSFPPLLGALFCFSMIQWAHHNATLFEHTVKLLNHFNKSKTESPMNWKRNTGALYHIYKQTSLHNVSFSLLISTFWLFASVSCCANSPMRSCSLHKRLYNEVRNVVDSEDLQYRITISIPNQYFETADAWCICSSVLSSSNCSHLVDSFLASFSNSLI